MIAQANALEGRVALVEGSTLQLPQVSRSANGFGTYAPANPAEAIGSTVPQAVPPPPPSRGCGTIGLIIMIVVAVVVTAITAGAAAPAIAQALGVGVNAGISALAGAVGAAAGSIASQGVGMVLGVQQDFSWRQVGLAALGGAVSGALGGIPGADGITQVSPGLIDTGAFARVDTLWGLAQRGGQAMLGNAITQGLAVATGLQDRYQWRQVAASAFAAPVGQLVGSYAGAYMNSFGASLAGGLTSGLLRSAIYNKGKVDYASIAADAFGNAIGNGVVEGMRPYSLGTASSGTNYLFDTPRSAIDDPLAEYRGGARPDYSLAVPGAWLANVGSAPDNNPVQAADPTRGLDVYLQDSGGGWQLNSRGGVSAPQTPVSIDPDTGVALYAMQQPGPIQMRPLPPLQGPLAAPGNPSFGQQYVAAVRDTFDNIYGDLDHVGADPATPDALRFMAAMVRNPATWFGQAVTGVATLGTYAFDPSFRGEVNQGIATFLANDPINTAERAFNRYLASSSGLEILRDSVNVIGGGAIGTPVAKLPGMALGEAASLTGTTGRTLLTWSQRLGDYSLEWPTLNGSFRQAGALAVPTIRNLRAEVTQLLPEGFDLVRISRGGTAILRYGDDTFYSVPKSQYALIPELRTLDTMGDVFTRRVQTIADRFNPLTDLSDAQSFRLSATPGGWLRDKFLSAYKGSYVHGQFGRALPDIPGGSAYRYGTVGPDVVSSIGGTGLKYEITQYTPSLNAIFFHTRKYPDDLLRYVLYR